MNLSTVKWAQWDITQSGELLSLFICVCGSLCTIVAHNTAHNRHDNFPSCPLDSHNCSDDVSLREGGGTQVRRKLVSQADVWASECERSMQVKTENNVLRDGTLIDLCGATLLWRSSVGLLSAPVRTVCNAVCVVEWSLNTSNMAYSLAHILIEQSRNLFRIQIY